jgi:hypothetical protein
VTRRLSNTVSNGFFLGLAVSMTFVVLAVILANLKSTDEGTTISQSVQLALAASLTLNLVTIFYTAFANSLVTHTPPLVRDENIQIAASGVLTGLFVILGVSTQLDEFETFAFVSTWQMWTTYSFIRILVKRLDINKLNLNKTITEKSIIASTATGLIGFYALSVIPLRGWSSSQEILKNSVAWQAVVYTISFIIINAYLFSKEYSFTSRKDAGIHNIISALGNYFFDKKFYYQRIQILGSTMIAAIAQMGLWGWGHIDASESLASGSWMYAGVSFWCLPSLVRVWSKIKMQSDKNIALEVASSLAVEPAVRLLRRNLKGANSWAAAIGMRTCVFTIDHDPLGRLSQSMPASLLQIRNEEILRCINDIIKNRLLHMNTAGQNIYGAADPESSYRPCVDIIKLFACLYLDAGPLIERRIQGLSSLLPIINPGLAKALKPAVILEMLQRNQWFFHFDYQWVDQHLIYTTSGTRYGVQINPVSNDLRVAIVRHLHKVKGLGSYIWIGKEAGERLMQEAPMLTSIIEPHTISSDDVQDHLVFVLKFETLVPRLQLYFDLDDTRQILFDFEPSHESAKLLNIFKVQIQQASTTEAMINLVESVANYPWRGFKEKDQALKIIVQAHDHNAKIIQASETTGKPVPRLSLKLRDAIQLGIEKIGYPSQILHLAQMHKIAQRDMQALVRSALNTKDARFEESWTLLGTLDLKRYPRAERKLIADLYSDPTHLSAALLNPRIHSKAIDGYLNIVKAEFLLRDETIDADECFENLVRALIKSQPTAETLLSLIDAVSYMTQITNGVHANILRHLSLAETHMRIAAASKGHYAKALRSRLTEQESAHIQS